MKKFLLSCALFLCAYAGQAQIYLNEFYVRPNATDNEYFELYNAGLTPANVGCYSLVTFFNDGTNLGFYVVDIPNLTIPARGFLVGSSAFPTFTYQGGSGTSNFNWNSGNINRYIYVGGSLVLDNTGAPYDNIFIKSSGTNPITVFLLFFCLKAAR
jgi:hypothetical protein